MVDILLGQSSNTDELDKAIAVVTRGEGAKLFETTAAMLRRSATYKMMLDQASQVGLDSTSVEIGFIAGIQAAGQMQVAQAIPKPAQIEIVAG